MLLPAHKGLKPTSPNTGKPNHVLSGFKKTLLSMNNIKRFGKWATLFV